MILSVLPAIVVLGLLIFLHELGHFAVAKWSGVMVTRFSLGFGPRLFAWTRGETEYAISAIPLGGYVKMLGEDPEEEVPVYEAHRAFSFQPLWKRVEIDGKEIKNWEQLSDTVRASGGRPLHFQVRRASGAVEEIVVTPEEKPERSPFGEEIGKAYLIGIERFVELEPVSMVNAIGLGAYQTYFW